MRRPSDVIHSVAEMAGDITRSLLPWHWGGMGGLRGWWGGTNLGVKFWTARHPIGEGSTVNYDQCRAYYRNSGDTALGGGFAKPIVDIQTSFMGLPIATTENESLTQFLNECVNVYWTDEIQQMFRDSMRDSKAIVRLCRPDVFDPLMTLDEAEHCRIEIIPPERVQIERNPSNKNIIERAVVHHKMQFVKDPGNVANGRDPVTEEHDVLEIITRTSYTFFDQVDNRYLSDLSSSNKWNFVPLLEVYNEFDSSLQGGISELENVIPFINAFHDVLTQGLQAHAYHSTPKIVMKLDDIVPFIKNNMPEAWDNDSGTVKPNAEVSWRGREIIFLQSQEDVGFLEAQSVLGDTKTLLEFLIDCICITSQTPEWAFMRVDSGSANSDRNAQTVPLIKKIERKRRNYSKPIQELLKMVQVSRGLIPVRPKISWEIVRPDDEVVFMQAFQQLVMALEVARERGEISDETYQDMIRRFVPVMKSNKQEFNPPPVLPALPQSTSTGIPVSGGPQGRNE